MSNLLARARAVAEQAANEYLASEAERIEQEAEGLRSLVAALVLEHGGPILVSSAALAQAAEVACQMQFIEGEGLVVDVAREPQQERLWEPEPMGSFTPALDLIEEVAEARAAPSEPAETIPEEPMEQTPEARHARYLQAHGQPVVAQGAVRPHKRPWDDPDDLQFQEVAQGRVEVAAPGPDGERPDWYDDRATELASGAGEGVNVRIGS